MALLRMAPNTTMELLDLIRKAAVYSSAELETRLERLPKPLSETPCLAGEQLVEAAILTPFQLKQLIRGKHRGLRLGEYRILDKIGVGGMGAVYLAKDDSLNRLVAIKVLSEGSKCNPHSADYFVREARSAAALVHPNIVSVYYFGVHDGFPYLAMEYIKGKTLDEIVNEAGPVDPVQAAEWIAQAAAGLQHAHIKGFIHRDIKPGNLIVSTEGVLKILDMGLARSRIDCEPLPEEIGADRVVGTADFISPEQAINSPAIDIRSDIYSLGATFFTLCTGRPPFAGTIPQKLAQHQGQTAPSVHDFNESIPEELAEIIARMLEKSPSDRYSDPAELIDALRPWLPGSTMAIEVNRSTESNFRLDQPTLINLVKNTAPTEKLPNSIPSAQRRWSTLFVVILIAVVSISAVLGSIIVLLPVGQPDGEVGQQSTREVETPPRLPHADEPLAIDTVPPNRTILYELKGLSNLKPFEATIIRAGSGEAGQYKRETRFIDNIGVLPDKWYVYPNSSDSPTCYFIEGDKSERAIGIQAVGKENIGMMVLPTLKQQQRRYRVYLTYQHNTDSPVELNSRTDGDWRRTQRLARLPKTGANWQSFVQDLTLDEAQSFRLVFQVRNMEPNQALRIRSLRIERSSDER